MDGPPTLHGQCCANGLSAIVDYACSPEVECTDGLRRSCVTHSDCSAGSLCCASGPVTSGTMEESAISRAGDQRCQAACAAMEAPIACSTAKDCSGGQVCCRNLLTDLMLGDERLIEMVRVV